MEQKELDFLKDIELKINKADERNRKRLRVWEVIAVVLVSVIIGQNFYTTSKSASNETRIGNIEANVSEIKTMIETAPTSIQFEMLIESYEIQFKMLVSILSENETAILEANKEFSDLRKKILLKLR